MSDDVPEKSASERAMAMFREACDKFRELSQPASSTPRLDSLYLYASATDYLRFFFRHPIRTMSSLYRTAINYPYLNAIADEFCTKEMLIYLEQYTLEDLLRLKSLTAVNVRVHKDRLTNPIFYIAAPVGAVLGIITLINTWAPAPKFAAAVADYLGNIIDPEVAGMTFLLMLYSLIVGFAYIAVRNMVWIIPAKERAQLLDELVRVVLEAKMNNKAT